MIPLDREVLIASGWDDSDTRDCMTSAPAVAGFIRLATRNSKRPCIRRGQEDYVRRQRQS